MHKEMETCSCWLHQARDFIKHYLTISYNFLCKHYQAFNLSDLELGSQALGLSTCAADSLGHMPFLWKDDSQLQRYLRLPIAMDVSKWFSYLLVVGVIVNFMYMVNIVKNSCQSKEK